LVAASAATIVIQASPGMELAVSPSATLDCHGSTLLERRDPHPSRIQAGFLWAQVGKGAIGRSSSVIRAAYSR
jgi:hypothetical protein